MGKEKTKINNPKHVKLTIPVRSTQQTWWTKKIGHTYPENGSVCPKCFSLL